MAGRAKFVVESPLMRVLRTCWTDHEIEMYEKLLRKDDLHGLR